jgi:replicative DNA helicase
MKGNVGAERAVLAGVCQYGREAFYDVCDIINPNTFTLPENQAAWKCVEEVLKESTKVDATSILAQAETNGLSIFFKKKEDVEFLRSLFQFPITLQNIRQFAKQIAKLELIQKEQNALLDAHHQLEMFNGTESVDLIVSTAEAPIFEITHNLNGQTETQPQLLGEGAEEELIELFDNPVDMIGIPTPFAIYNSLIGGGVRHGVTLIGARPKIGKSTLAINTGLHVCEEMEIPVLYIDTEMAGKEQRNRITACLSEIDVKLIETGQAGKIPNLRQRAIEATRKLKQLPFYHKWVGGKPFEEIMSIIRRWIYSTVGFDENGKTKPHLIIYDYFKLMDSETLDKMAEHQAIGFQISALSDFCKQYQSPCLAFVQLNRDGINKDSGDVLAQSDRLLWLCTSAAIFKRKCKEEMVEDGYENGNRKLILLEGRFGEPLEEGDYLCMNLDGAKSTIKEVGLKSKLIKAEQERNSGFEIDDSDEEDADLEL